MSSNNVAHVASVDKGLKMKIKRTKGPNRVDAKHEVVKSDPLSKLATTSSGQSVAATSLPSTPVPLSVLLSAANANGGPTSSATGLHAVPVTSSLTLLSSASSSSIISSSSSPSSFMPSSGAMGVPNPTVALQKAGMLPDGYSNNSPASCNRSPVKANSSGTHGLDSRAELKSPKAKAAYNKKVRDNKGKTDGLTAVGPSFSVNGPSIPNTDTRTSMGLTSNNQTFNPAPTPFTSQAGVNNSTMTSEPRPGDTVNMKRENPVHDPYEFNAKVEDKIELPPKKLKLEKTDCIETAISPQPQPQQHSSPPLMLHPPSVSKQQQQQLQQHHHQQLQQQPQKRSVGVDVRSIGILTEPDSLGPCEPGTQVGLEGIVWKETDNGLLVVNVTWRGKTYVGTLMDATRYAWAPPRPNGCESPVSDFETRTPKGRGKRNCRNSVQTSEKLPEGRRLRKGRRGTVNSSSSNFTAPPSPARSDASSSSSNNMKRRTKPNDVDGDKAKKSRPCSREVTGADSPTPDGYIVCPEPNCQKKYKHMNGLRYHRTHAHRKSSLTDDAKDEEDEDEDEEEKSDKKDKTPISERTVRMKSKERQRIKEQQMVSDRDSKDSLEDDIPLKEIANKATGQANVHKVDAVRTSKVEEQSHGNDDSGNSVSGLAVSIKTDAQVLLTKTDENVQKEPASPVTTSATGCKIQDSNLAEISDSSLTVVPSVSSISETSHSSVIHNNSNSIDLSSLTTALSQTCNSISAVPLTGLTVVSQASPNLSVVTTQTLPLKTSAARQTTATTPTSVLGLTVTADKQNHGRNSMSAKPVSSSRPIVPAPSPQMMTGGSGSFSQNVNSVLFSQGHASTLKPIQPKPTVLRDYSAPNPALSDLNKEKPRKSKKKKDHSETGASSATGNPDFKGQVSSKDGNRSLLDMISQDDLYRSERTAVIKNSNRPEPFDTSNLSSSVSKLAFPSSMNSNKQPCSISSDRPATSGSRVAIPPSTLSVYSSVDSRNMITDDVHSPAYSDISDANDSNSPFQPDSPKKDSPADKDGQINGSLHLGQDANTLSQHYGNMFYFGGPSSYLQHGVGSQISSPTLSDGLKKKDDMEEKRPSSNDSSFDKKEGGHNMQDTELQQKSLFNYLSHLHGVSPAVAHLPYNLAGYNSAATDSSYAIIAQQALDQHKRLQQHHDHHTFKSEDGSGKQSSSGTSNVHRNLGPGYESSGSKLRMGNNISEGHVHQKWSDGDKNQGVKNRHNDIHHTLKESTESKPHTGLNQDKLNYHMTKQQQNDIHRAQLYKQHKQHQHQDKRKSTPELTSNSSHLSSSSSVVTSRSSFENKLQDLIPHDLIKKECVLPEDSPRLETVNSKQLDTKDSISQLLAKCSSLEATCTSRSPSQSSTPGIPQPSLASSSSSSSSTTVSSTVPSSQPSSTAAAAALPASLVNSLPTAGTAFPYAPYYPHFRPVQMDTMYRALSPHIIGYSNGPHGYIHPTQLGYRVPLVETGKKSPDSADPQRGDGPGLVNNTGYSPVHKLHELQEKNRPSPGVHPSSTNKSGNGDSLHSSSSSTPDPSVEKVKDKQREYSNSPPTQRHVHTHHHTHVMSVYTPDAYSKLMKF